MKLMYISLIFSILPLIILYFLRVKKIKFGIRVITAMLFGITVGVVFGKESLIIEPVGKIYVSLIKMIVLPLVITSLISSVTSLSNIEQLKKIGVKTITLLLITTGIAAVIGIVIGNIMNIGVGIDFTLDSTFKPREIPSFSQVILDMIPVNPFASMSNGKIIPVIVFSIFIAVAIIIEGAKKPEAVKIIKDFNNSASIIMFRVTKIVISLTPYGVFSLMVSVSAKNGISTLIPLIKVVIAVYIACIFHIIFTHGSLILFVVKVNPIKFLKKIFPAQVVAFTTQSSYGSLPITIKSLVDNVKISEKIASFAASLGATMGMNACGGIYPAIVAIFVANVFNINLSMYHYVLLVLTTVVASIGMAGVPGTATIAATVVLANLGLPIEGLAMVLGVDVIIDMMRTMTNVTGASTIALLVANYENEFYRELF